MINRYATWAADHPQLAVDFPLDRVPASADMAALRPLQKKPPAGKTATRKASGAALNALAGTYPALIGGSADLAGSTNTTILGGDVSNQHYSGRTIHFGIREHAMAAALNGIALHGVCAVRQHLPGVLRLSAARIAVVRADAPTGHLHLHPRFSARRRGRADPSADRAY
ncbi:hypothetical protein MAGR_66790 [Mycolicibacterium agri]|uniref:Transketolase-like pyrimidine-binding domain-containing protein n=1 Tax=Mycolicibacterium agri TaxID=36811 RepID=A0A7I9WD32_MYCAG|nr:hypothetical protein MAGR_66790 [Mycolicibacterium agri]